MGLGFGRLDWARRCVIRSCGTLIWGAESNNNLNGVAARVVVVLQCGYVRERDEQRYN